MASYGERNECRLFIVFYAFLIFFCLKEYLMPRKKIYKCESDYQADLIKTIKKDLGEDNLDILKNDADYRQGIPDLLIIYKDRHAYLEAKISETAPHRPNQDFYIEKAKRNSFGAFIYPENQDQVLADMYAYLTH